MAQFAGQMTSANTVSIDGLIWANADGSMVRQTRFPDYRRTVGRQVGGYGLGLLKLPHNPGWAVRLADDSLAAALPSAPTATTPPAKLRIDALAPAYYGSPSAVVPITGKLSPAGTAYQVTLVTNGTPGAFRALAADTAGNVSDSWTVPTGTNYTLRFQLAAGGGVFDSAQFAVTAQPIVVAFDPVPDPMPQGTYNFTGSVTPSGAALTINLRHPDHSTTAATVTVTGTRFSASVYLQTLGGPHWLEAAATAGTVTSETFQVVRGVLVNAPTPEYWLASGQSTVPVLLSGQMLGNVANEHLEYATVVAGTPGTFAPVGLNSMGGFGAYIAMPTGTWQFRVRKVENPGVFTDSTVFRVRPP